MTLAIKKIRTLSFSLAFLAMAIDQATKIWAEASLALGEYIPVVPFFNIRLGYNTGAAFSFLSDAGGWQQWFFIIFAIVVSVVLSVWIIRLKTHEAWTGIGLGLILGGAVGNVIDRIAYGHVIDFLDVYYGQWHFPTFNIADSAITLGAGILLMLSFSEAKR